MGSYPSAERARADAAELARRLRDTDVTLTALCREYHCGYSTIRDAILTVMAAREYRRHCRTRRARGGLAGRFQPGRRPWNTGLKGGAPPGAEKGQFRRGQLRGMAARHWRPVGTIEIRFDRPPRRLRNRKNAGPGPGRRYIKVREGPHRRCWEVYARYLWAQLHGPIPPGLVIAHADGDALNDDPDNLICITRAENLRRLQQIRPAAPQRRALVSARARRKRARDERRLGAAQMITTYECRGCGASHERPPARCPKCNGYTYDVVRRRQGFDARLVGDEVLK